MVDDRKMEIWRNLVTQTQHMAEKEGADATYRTGLDLDVSPQDGDSPQAALLRACAHKLIPPEYEWELISTIGGAAHLMLKRVVEPEVETEHG